MRAGSEGQRWGRAGNRAERPFPLPFHQVRRAPFPLSLAAPFPLSLAAPRLSGRKASGAARQGDAAVRAKRCGLIRVPVSLSLSSHLRLSHLLSLSSPLSLLVHAAVQTCSLPHPHPIPIPSHPHPHPIPIPIPIPTPIPSHPAPIRVTACPAPGPHVRIRARGYRRAFQSTQKRPQSPAATRGGPAPRARPPAPRAARGVQSGERRARPEQRGAARPCGRREPCAALRPRRFHETHLFAAPPRATRHLSPRQGASDAPEALEPAAHLPWVREGAGRE